MGMYKLEKIRSEVPQSKLQGLDELGVRALQMQLIGDYLNGYTGKMSLMNGKPGQTKKIKIDKEEFD
jgi:hypothetical protein